MNKTKNLLLVIVCGIIAVASFSSCINNDNNDYSIDAATQKKYMTTISMLSPYSNNARLYYSDGYNAVKYDSIKGNSVYCRLSADSVLNIKNFPICKLDSAINISENETKGTYRELFDAIHNSKETVDIKGLYCIPYSNWATTNGYQYLIAASAQFKVTYGGEEHNVLFAFDQTQSWGNYNAAKLSANMSLVLGAIYLDYKDEKNYGSRLNTNYFRPIQLILTKD